MAKLNPFDKVKDLDIPDRGHVPWPAWVIDYVRAHAWPDLVRMVRLGVMTCQRGSDMIRMGPEHRFPAARKLASWVVLLLAAPSPPRRPRAATGTRS